MRHDVTHQVAMVVKWLIMADGAILGGVAGVFLLDDYLWWLLFKYDNIPREKQIAFIASAMVGLAVGAVGDPAGEPLAWPMPDHRCHTGDCDESQ